MSILLHTADLGTKEIRKSKRGEPMTSSILLVSVAISIAIVLLIFAGVSYTEAWMEQYSICRDKIIGLSKVDFTKASKISGQHYPTVT